MESIKELEEWYLSQCNEGWEHAYGIEIGTLDNPGWFLKIDLADTDIASKEYKEHSYGLAEVGRTSGNDWIVTKLEDRKFVGYGGPQKLDELIKLFLAWARENF